MRQSTCGPSPGTASDVFTSSLILHEVCAAPIHLVMSPDEILRQKVDPFVRSSSQMKRRSTSCSDAIGLHADLVGDPRWRISPRPCWGQVPQRSS